MLDLQSPQVQALLRAMRALEIHHGLAFTHATGEAGTLDFAAEHAALTGLLREMCPQALNCLPDGGPEDSLGAIARQAAGLRLMTGPEVEQRVARYDA